MEVEPKKIPFNWDEGGVLDWVASQYGTGKWRNPLDTGDVLVKSSSMVSGQLRSMVEKNISEISVVTRNEPFSWVQVELPVAVCPTHYRMSHMQHSPKSFLRSWAFCGSYDGEDWRVLCQHKNDKTLVNESADTLTGAWEVRMTKPEFYPYFRIVMFEEGNSESTNTLIASCLELFGSVRHRQWPGKVSVTIA
eukprot:TRINITY_DN3938_c5_g1_i1.p1 TRINITY_DN3938_c5_g1~~TRINITY_DN3938_c5_g1_i1.p1  ORF type:complete len:193 (+),score=8.32 TRINITY_DN3938_c5_g1_i1:73-651(+)